MTTIVVVLALFPPCIRRSATSQGCTKRCGTGIGRSGMTGNLEDICFVSQFVFVSDFDLFSFQISAIFFWNPNRPCHPAGSFKSCIFKDGLGVVF